MKPATQPEIHGYIGSHSGHKLKVSHSLLNHSCKGEQKVYKQGQNDTKPRVYYSKNVQHPYMVSTPTIWKVWHIVISSKFAKL